jgi:DNA-binding PadR family transcriptional regulator
MAITKSDKIKRTFFLGFVRLHILYHASRGPIYGLQMIHELSRHGYQLSPGTLYPILHGLEKEGFLQSEPEVVEGKMRRTYTLTPAGQEALRESIDKVRELFNEISQS